MSSPSNLWSLPHALADQRAHEAELVGALRRMCASGSCVLGAEAQAFESEFADFLGVSHVVGVASGMDGIEVMMRALEIGAGSKVVVPSFAPSAVAAGVARSGAEPVFADIEAGTFTLCARSLDAVLRSPQGRGVKAAVVVHRYGNLADWDGLQQVAQEHGIELLEDCSQAHGATWHGRKAGTLGRAAAFNFYPTKNLAALGDAGALATNDQKLAERLRLIGQSGWKQRYINEHAGVHSHLDEVQAAVLRVKLRVLHGSLQQRRKLAAEYDAILKDSHVVKAPMVRRGCEHAYHQYVVRAERRDELIQHLRREQIPVALHYPVPLHQQRGFGGSQVSLRESDRAAAAVISLPLHPCLSATAVGAVCDVMERFDHARC